MSSDALEFFGIELPLFARSLCHAAMTEARNLIGDMSKDEFDNEANNLFAGAREHSSMITDGPLETDSFNALDLSSYPSSKEQAKTFVDNVGLNPDDPSDFVQQMQSSDNAQQKIYQAALIRFLVNSISDVERELLATTDTPDYAAAMASMDELLLILHHTYAYAASFDLGTKYLDDHLSKIEGGRKGGKAKQARRADLAEHVLEKAAERFANFSASAAAREIERLLDHDTWLKDGKPYYQDPVTTFTQWIRDRRRSIPENTN